MAVGATSHQLQWIACIEWIDVCNINGTGNTTNGGTIVYQCTAQWEGSGGIGTTMGVRKIIETQSAAITVDLVLASLQW